jgi:hypothetical protein
MMLVIITIVTIVIFILITIITNVSMGTTYQLINRRKDNGQQWVLCTSTLECDSIPPWTDRRKMIHTTLKESMW